MNFFDSIPIKQFEIRNSSVYEKFVQFKTIDLINLFLKRYHQTLKKIKKIRFAQKKRNY